MMKLSDVFGIGPEYAAQLADCGIHTIVDLAQADDLEALSRDSGVPLDLLRGWQGVAAKEASTSRLRGKVVAACVGAVAVLAIVLAAWSGAEAPTPTEKTYNQALAALAAGDTAAAARVLDRTLATGPGTAYLHNLRGVLYRRSGNDAAARRQFLDAVEADSSYAEAWSNLGSLALREGDARQSVMYYETALERGAGAGKQRGVIYLNLSLAYSQAGDLPGARTAVERALDLDPGLAPAHVQRGYLQQSAGQLEEARTSYMRAIRADSQNVLANYNLFVLQRQEGDLAGAREAARRLQEIAPTNVLAQRAASQITDPGATEGRIDVASDERGAQELTEAAQPGIDLSDAGAADSAVIDDDSIDLSGRRTPQVIVSPPIDRADSLRAATITVPPESIAAHDEPVYVPRDVDPTLKNRRATARIIERTYPESLRNSRVQGTVIVWVQIDVEGKVQRTQIQQSSGHAELDSAAVAAATQFEFTPAIYQDNPVAVWVQVPITFEVN